MATKGHRHHPAAWTLRLQQFHRHRAAEHEARECLKKYGQRLDVEIAEEMRMPLATVRGRIAELRASGAIVTCKLTRYDGDKTIDAWECRVSGYTPKPAPGRKAKAAR